MSMACRSLYLWSDVPCVYGVAFPIYMEGLSHVFMGPVYLWRVIPCIHGVMFSVSMGGHSLDLWGVVPCIYGVPFLVSIGEHLV